MQWIEFAGSARTDRGFSLLMVMFFIGMGFLLMTGVLRYSGASSTATERYNEYYTTLAAAEAATEKVVSQVSGRFQNLGVSGVDSALANFGNAYPEGSDLAWVGWADEWGGYEFMNPLGGNNSTYVAKLSNEQYTNSLNWKYSGFGGYAASYRIVSNARRAASGNNIIAAVRQDVQVASVPLFEFGVFYALEMEINPSQNMTLTGRVHCNTNIYCTPSSPTVVTFAGDVTSAHKILRQPNPNDTVTRTPPFNVNFLGAQDWKIASLKLPIGSTNAPTVLAPNTPSVLREIIEIPPASELRGSLLGQQRYYNKADLIIIVTNGAVIATGNAYNAFAPVDWNVVSNFVNTNVFYVSGGATNLPRNLRENKELRLTEIDIEELVSRFEPQLRTILSRYPTNIYVADLRTNPANVQSGVRLKKGRLLPPTGLTIATLNPLYVQGHYNAPLLATTNTSFSTPASLIADAITILSDNWQDANSSNPSLAARPATDTTINAAIMAGIVPSDGDYYSGGVENFLRLLEDWGGDTLTFNGSIVALYKSRIAIGPWGASGVVYSPPIRRYAFDENFKDPAKLPSGTPLLRTVIRQEWVITQANSSL
ncbi:MAG TPA: hypothetical protein VJW76_10575 [Verrucomicrobiae bacterium]|nr:hypothetical protein [Verrucomicrobiae bacterium]